MKTVDSPVNSVSLVVISPEDDEPREAAVLGELLADGLERYHVRKPGWTRERQAAWLGALPPEWRVHLILHQHHELAVEYGCGGCHEKDGRAVVGGRGWRSRSCHSLDAMSAALGHYDSVFLSPMFPSISKPGYRAGFDLSEVARVLARRDAAQRRTQVVALGGITAETGARALALGFDGVAVLGTLWRAADPGAEFSRLQEIFFSHAA